MTISVHHCRTELTAHSRNFLSLEFGIEVASLSPLIFGDPNFKPRSRIGTVKVNYTGIAVRNVTVPHRCGNSHATRDHTVLPATRQR